MLLADEFHGAGGRGFQAADDVQQRRLAAARRTDDAEELAVAHIEINAADSANVALARRVHFGQSANDDFHVNNDRNLLFSTRCKDVKIGSNWLQLAVSEAPPSFPIARGERSVGRFCQGSFP